MRARSAVPPKLRGDASFQPAQSTGLFVGISEFKDERFAEIPFAVDDAIDLAYLFAFELGLVEPPKVVLRLSGKPKKSATEQRFQELRAAGARAGGARLEEIYGDIDELSKEVGESGLFLVTLATHGFSDQGADFLIASHSLFHRVVRTGIALSALFDDIAKARAPSRLVLIDTCRERLSTEARIVSREPGTAISESFARAFSQASGQVVLSGTTLGGYSYDNVKSKNGVFTAAILDGLRGQAPADERHFITARTLADYVNTRVTNWVRANRPLDELSQGIGQQIEGAAAQLPLAFDPVGLQADEEYRRRRVAALARLKVHIGDLIRGSLYDDIAIALTETPPHFDWNDLFEKMEALPSPEQLPDSQQRDLLQRGFLGYLEEHPEICDRLRSHSEKETSEPASADNLKIKNSETQANTTHESTSVHEPEGKNLVICCDGTGNEPGTAGGSNVSNLVHLLRDQNRQIVYYTPGLGTEGSSSAQTPIAEVALRMLSLCFGYGLSKNIADAYKYLMKHYQPGDRVYLFGFGSGAYTVRAIAGLLYSIGLLQEGSNNLLDYAIRLYRTRGESGRILVAFQKKMRLYSREYSVPIHFLGAWDTVKSIGLLRSSIRLHHTGSLPNVINGRHAVALAEKRSKFRNDMWTATGQAEGDCQTMWFAGAHSDVGGGYDDRERGLADIALEWMLDGAERHGLRINRRRFVQECDHRRGLVRLERAQELISTGTERIWREIAADLGVNIMNVNSWTRSLQQYFVEPDLEDVAKSLELDVIERYERSHNPLTPVWWVVGWWRRKLPERAWIHRSVIERIGRGAEDMQYLTHPLKLLLKITDDKAKDLLLKDSVLVARLRESDSPRDVLIQTLNADEMQAISDAIRQNPSLPATEALKILRSTDIALWQRSLNRLSLDQHRNKELADLLSNVAKKIDAQQIKGPDGAFAGIQAFLRKRSLTDAQKDQIKAAAPHLLEALAEWPWTDSGSR